MELARCVSCLHARGDSLGPRWSQTTVSTVTVHWRCGDGEAVMRGRDSPVAASLRPVTGYGDTPGGQ